MRTAHLMETSETGESILQYFFAGHVYVSAARESLGIVMSALVSVLLIGSIGYVWMKTGRAKEGAASDEETKTVKLREGLPIGRILAAVSLMALLGATVGFNMTTSRDGVVGTIVPAVLVAFAGAVGYSLGTAKRGNSFTIAMFAAFLLAFVPSSNLGAILRGSGEKTAKNSDFCASTFSNPDLLANDVAYHRARELFRDSCTNLPLGQDVPPPARISNP